MATHKTVSVGDRRSAERMFRIVQAAAFDEGLTPEKAGSLALTVAMAAKDEGLVLTAQASGSSQPIRQPDAAETQQAGNHNGLLMLPEVAEMTRLSENTLRFMRHQGKGPKSGKIGRRVMYREADVIEWVNEQLEDIR